MASVEIFQARRKVPTPTTDIKPPMTCEGRNDPKLRIRNLRENIPSRPVNPKERERATVSVARTSWGEEEEGVILLAIERINGTVKRSGVTRVVGNFLPSMINVVRPDMMLPVAAIEERCGNRSSWVLLERDRD